MRTWLLGALALSVVAVACRNDAVVVVGLSGRGDKDAPQVREILKARRARSS